MVVISTSQESVQSISLPESLELKIFSYKIRLESLNVSDNHLATLYLEFAFMPKLTEIVRESNDWRYRPLFFFTLMTGPGRSLGLKLSDARVYEPQIRSHIRRHAQSTARLQPTSFSRSNRPFSSYLPHICNHTPYGTTNSSPQNLPHLSPLETHREQRLAVL